MKTERRAADTILERGVRVKLPAPLFWKVLRKKEIAVVVKQPSLGTLLSVSRIALKNGLGVEQLEKIKDGTGLELHNLVQQHSKELARITAILFLNSRWGIKLFARPVARWLLWKLTPRKLAEVAILAAAFGGYEDFTTTIRLIGAMRMNVTAPKNLSHEKSGS